MTTTQDLRARLNELRAEHDAFYAALVPLAQVGSDGRMRWNDVDIAEWLGASLDAVRARIVADLHAFAVDDACAVALLHTTEVVDLMQGKLSAPRLSKLNYVDSELAAIGAYLADLGD